MLSVQGHRKNGKGCKGQELKSLQKQTWDCRFLNRNTEEQKNFTVKAEVGKSGVQIMGEGKRGGGRGAEKSIECNKNNCKKGKGKNQ